ncbi:putative glycosyl transferase [Stanieria sp. NIES-3757]|nr:putative glycosyl transferase [Stanieria sp. NIES-3757]
MKINWFCPLPPEKTDIAHYTARILKELHQRAEITLWTDKQVWLPELEEYARIIHYHPDHLSDSDFENADVNIYHIGNNKEFHGSIWQVSRRYPGIVVIHDLNLHYLFTCLYPRYLEAGTTDRNAYVELMRNSHGVHCQQDLNKFFAGKLDWGTISERYPLTFAAIENALGVIVHTQDAYNIFTKDRRCKCPVLYSPLPYPATPIQSVSRDETISRPPYRLIVFGYLGGLYRRVQSVLEALGGMAEKNAFHLDIYGQIWDEDYIRGLIQKFALENQVTLHGYVEETELDWAMANADLAFNLRYPTGGEASGSQMRIWSHGLPSLVTRIGWYAELPEDAVVFVSHDREIADLKEQLQNFLANPAKFAQIGQRGQQILAKQHHPSLYSRKVVEFAKVVGFSWQVNQSRLSLSVASSPQVSVIIPTYNCSRYLKKAIASVLDQTYTDYELIVVDDGSTDNTQEIVQPLRDRIRYTSFQHNQGISVARNRGIEIARGNLITFLDADNWLLPHALEVQVNYFTKNSNVGMINSGFKMVNTQDEVLREVKPWLQYPELNLATWLTLRPILANTIMLRREWLEWAGGLDTNFSYADDLNLIFRLALMNCKTAWLPEVTLCCRQTNKDFVHHTPKKAKYTEMALKNLFNQGNLPQPIKSRKKQTLYQSFVWLAWNLYQTGNSREEAEYLQKSLEFTDSKPEEVIFNWVEHFNNFAFDYGYDFDAYQFSSQPEWKKLLRSILI